ncbi:hypothetical protein LTR16_000054 [Cryomyces antarcticus]|uniref:Uncharacterized protein n=1 Tax=Cryomyces antarcticus TaxID=329879 RepID=A0ABR0M9F6_9PEZI|nr:hypothetical protein LTR39_000507 [Cryomyces antarcticus]KAK5297037.1 hypothetical protein LTR16_000054 [Cryomyces antarcticus]
MTSGVFAVASPLLSTVAFDSSALRDSISRQASSSRRLPLHIGSSIDPPRPSQVSAQVPDQSVGNAPISPDSEQQQLRAYTTQVWHSQEDSVRDGRNHLNLRNRVKGFWSRLRRIRRAQHGGHSQLARNVIAAAEPAPTVIEGFTANPTWEAVTAGEFNEGCDHGLPSSVPDHTGNTTTLPSDIHHYSQQDQRRELRFLDPKRRKVIVRTRRKHATRNFERQFARTVDTGIANVNRSLKCQCGEECGCRLSGIAASHGDSNVPNSSLASNASRYDELGVVEPSDSGSSSRYRRRSQDVRFAGERFEAAPRTSGTSLSISSPRQSGTTIDSQNSTTDDGSVSHSASVPEYNAGLHRRPTCPVPGSPRHSLSRLQTNMLHAATPAFYDRSGPPPAGVDGSRSPITHRCSVDDERTPTQENDYSIHSNGFADEPTSTQVQSPPYAISSDRPDGDLPPPYTNGVTGSADFSLAFNSSHRS